MAEHHKKSIEDEIKELRGIICYHKSGLLRYSHAYSVSSEYLEGQTVKYLTELLEIKQKENSNESQPRE